MNTQTTQTEPEDITVKLLSRDAMKALAVKKYSKEHKVLLVCDFTMCLTEDQRQSYVRAIEDLELLSPEQVTQTMSGEILLMVIPFFTLTVATGLYRKIKHASHFVTLWADGEPYAVEC